MASSPAVSWELAQFSFPPPPIRGSSSIADLGDEPANLQAGLDGVNLTPNHGPDKDPVVSVSSKKLQTLIDALLATTLALRQSLPGISIYDNLEAGKGITDPPVGPRRSSTGGVGNRVYGAEDLQTILDTPQAESFVLAEEGKREIEAFCQGRCSHKTEI